MSWTRHVVTLLAEACAPLVMTIAEWDTFGGPTMNLRALLVVPWVLFVLHAVAMTIVFPFARRDMRTFKFAHGASIAVIILGFCGVLSVIF